MTDEPEATGRSRTQFKPGESGNPNGRPKGSRNKLAEMFWSDLFAAWQAKGAAAIDAMIADKPGDFVKVVASQMPKEFLVKSASLEDISDGELAEFIASIRSLAGTSHLAKGGERDAKAPRKGAARRELN